MKFEIIAISILIFMTLGVVWGSDNIDYFNESTKITFEGISFNIPEGYGTYKSPENYDGLGSDGKTCFYKDEVENKLEITVISDWMGMSLDDFHKKGSSKTTIKGHEGWKYKEKNLHYFGYIKGDNGILVGVTNQSDLSKIIL